MESCAGECDFESMCAACLGGALGPGMHGLLARSASEARALSSIASRLLTSLNVTVMPYAERGRVCVACVQTLYSVPTTALTHTAERKREGEA